MESHESREETPFGEQPLDIHPMVSVSGSFGSMKTAAIIPCLYRDFIDQSTKHLERRRAASIRNTIFDCMQFDSGFFANPRARRRRDSGNCGAVAIRPEIDLLHLPHRCRHQISRRDSIFVEQDLPGGDPRQERASYSAGICANAAMVSVASTSVVAIVDRFIIRLLSLTSTTRCELAAARHPRSKSHSKP